MKNNTLRFLSGGGLMGELIRSKDWSDTLLGIPEQWPSELKITTGIVLSSPFPMCIGWGKEYIQIYNDAYISILGLNKHPLALGNSTKISFAETWKDITGPMYDKVMDGEAIRFSNFKVFLERNGSLEECYFNFSKSPISDEDGNIGGVLVTVLETTDNINLLDSLNDAKKHLETAKAEIEKQRDRLKRFFMQAPVGICILEGPDLKFELVNVGYQQFFPDRELLGKPLLEALPEIVAQPIEKIIFDVYNNNKTVEGKELLIPLARTDNGEIENRYFNFIYQPKHDIYGNVDGVLVFAFEITDMVATKILAKENTERFESMINQLPVPMLVTMGDEMILEEVNPLMLDLIDKDISIKGLSFNEVFPELLSQPLYNKLLATYNNGEIWSALEQMVLLNKQGSDSIGYFNVSYRPFIESGRITGVIHSAIDVTEQVNARKKLEKAEDTLKLAISAAQLGLFDLDLENGTMEWDPRCRTLFGISHNDKVTYDHDFINGLHLDDRDRVLNVIERVLVKSVSNGDYDIIYRTIGFEDQKIRWLRAMGKAYFDEQEKPIRFLGAVVDITEFKQDEIRKNDFIGMVSHELKTPLTTLNGYAQLLHLKSKKREDQYFTDVLGKMITQVKKMSSMINGFLNVSRLEAGKIHLDKRQFDFKLLMNEIVEEIRLTTESHSLEYTHDHESVLLHADKDKIGTVITNLITNAVKYSPKGKVVFIDFELEEGNLKFCVKDEGMGIAKEDLGRLFDRYYRVESSEIQHISGFGIGLYLSAEIINSHKGSIWAESEIGKGSTFYFTLPLEI